MEKSLSDQYSALVVANRKDQQQLAL